MCTCICSAKQGKELISGASITNTICCWTVGLFFEDYPSPQINAPQINLHSCGRLVRLAGGVCYGPHSHSFANKAYKAVTPEPVLLLL